MNGREVVILYLEDLFCNALCCLGGEHKEEVDGTTIRGDEKDCTPIIIQLIATIIRRATAIVIGSLCLLYQTTSLCSLDTTLHTL